MVDNFNGCHIHFLEIYTLTLVYRRGSIYYPPTDFFLLHKNAKETDPGHLSNLKFILCGHFDEKYFGGTPKDG